VIHILIILPYGLEVKKKGAKKHPLSVLGIV